jgi:hypothetical protein
MKLTHRGLAVEVPRGWDARIYQRSDSAVDATDHPVLHAANFALPEDRGDFGSNAVERMGPGHILVALLEFHPDSASTALFASRGLPRTLTPDLFSPSQLQRTLAGQAGTQVFFNDGGRAFCLYVVLGSHRGRAGLVPQVNAVLDAIEITPRAGR